MLMKYSGNIVCDATGDATIYLGNKIRGRVVVVIFTPGTLDTGGDLYITGETSGVPIFTKITAHGTAVLYLYPKAFANGVADGVAGGEETEDVWLFRERIKVIEDDGGNLGAGSIEIWVDEPQTA